MTHRWQAWLRRWPVGSFFPPRGCAAKHLLATRPIFHRLDETIRGHVFCSFLALVLKAELEARMVALGQRGSWPAIIADLEALAETEVE